MKTIEPLPRKSKKLLIITCSGGGGLLQTANAKEQEALAKDPHLIVIKKDLLKDWAPFSSFMINFWNRAQKKGSIAAQMICVRGQFFCDFLLYPYVFFHTLKTLFKEDVDEVIDTQPLGTSAIMKALKIFNRKRKKTIRVEKVIVDLPTKQATHFFKPIRKLSKEDKKWLRVSSISPLLENGETAEEFWQKNCGLSEKEIHLEDAFVRHAFRKYMKKEKPRERMHLKIHFKNREELSWMKKSFQRGKIEAKIGDGEIDFSLDPEDRVVTILLGSQPAFEATVKYVEQFISIARRFPQIDIYLFAFCADHEPGRDSLLKAVSELCIKLTDYPKNLSIIPFSFQKDVVIAPLFFRSDITCTRSGGQTAMELMCVSTGEIWIHSEAKKGQDILKGISGWEAASARYLEKMHGAKIVTPNTFIPFAEEVLRKGESAYSACVL